MTDECDHEWTPAGVVNADDYAIKQFPSFGKGKPILTSGRASVIEVCEKCKKYRIEKYEHVDAQTEADAFWKNYKGD